MVGRFITRLPLKFVPSAVFLTIAAALAVIPPTGSDAIAGQKLTVVADEWPPFSGEFLPNNGLSLDVITAVLERAGYSVDVAVIPWARIMAGAREGAYDVVGSLFFTDDMTEFVTYSEAYYTTDVKFVRKIGGAATFAGLDDLLPYSIAVGDGFLYAEDFDGADHLNKITVTTTLQCVRMVAHGRADLTLDSQEVVLHALNHEDPSLGDLVEFLPNPLASRGIHMAVRNDLPDRDTVIADFNRALSEMRSDGSYHAIVTRHHLLGN